MESVLTEWLSLIVRWLHVVAGIAWIGSSFYFIHLDLSLKPRAGLPDGVQGRRLAGARRRLLSHGEVSGRARPHAGRADLVQVGSLHHLAVRLRAAGHRLLSRRRALPDRQDPCSTSRAPTAAAIAFGSLAGRLAALRGAVPLAARPPRGGAGARRLRVPGRRSPTPSPMCSAGAAPSPRSAR